MTSSVHDLADKSGSDEQQKQSQPEIQHQSLANVTAQPGMPVQSAPYVIPPNPMAMGHIMSQTYPMMDPYYGGMVAAYGGQTAIHSSLAGVPHPGVPLPADAVEEPVYVNAKQYHGILRRRQSRAKAESENKLIKSRKPYLHESRHQHALKRARGCGGRFLNTKADGSQQNSEPVQHTGNSGSADQPNGTSSGDKTQNSEQ
ncbi:nuclear transcription factor Y subunit A-7 [Dioscorea cayenensis subsp. rotundata]|uniref:Nuclear transcription factor Y subunit n=1 Tax=Dioscorea cayennensis subsp. rotundata TaxID=55577 RepID=A0AB40AIC4_DIOCR|nr:nuclear transcription factor Y subunit A-7 [Dioscorea cayenensis subsp. rotundata]